MTHPESKILLIGLPGTGMPVVLREIQRLLKNEGKALDVLDVDKVIGARATIEDPVIIEFLSNNPQIEPGIFRGRTQELSDKCADISAKFIKSNGEPLWRDLEAKFIIDILLNYDTSNKLLELGAKAFLYDTAQSALLSEEYVPILLLASEEEVIDRLGRNDLWKSYGNYRLAGEDGWQALSRQHRDERLDDLRKYAKIAIEVDNLDSEQSAMQVLASFRALNDLNIEDVRLLPISDDGALHSDSGYILGEQILQEPILL